MDVILSSVLNAQRLGRHKLIFKYKGLIKHLKFNRAQTHRWHLGKYFCLDAIFIWGIALNIFVNLVKNIQYTID